MEQTIVRISKMTLEYQKIIDDIYSINGFYSKQKFMSPYFKGWIKGALEKNKIELIEENGSIVAFVTYSVLKRKPFITLQKLAVRNDHLRRGYGKKLLGVIKQKALNDNNRAIQLRVVKINDNAVRFYESQGFIVEDDKKHDYSMRMVWKNV